MTFAGNLFWWLCSTVAVLSALGTILAHNPLRSAISLLMHILALAGLYLTLHAHLLAAIQLLVYAGAVVVLFIFVIMLIGPSGNDKKQTRVLLTRTLGAGLLGVVVAFLASILLTHRPVKPLLMACPPGASADCDQFGGVRALGKVIFTDAMVPFEVASILLLVAILGAIAVARGKASQKAEAAMEAEAKS